jgi:hypothetical protein
MESREFVSDVREKLEQLVARMHIVQAEVTQDALNTQTSYSAWTLAQIVEHMILANEGYVKRFQSILDGAVRGEDEVKLSFFGKMLLKGSTPSSNVPAPKALHPAAGPYDQSIFDRWLAQHQLILQFVDGLEGIDLTRTKFRNALFPVIRMNLADLLELFCTHDERHVLQIEQIAKSLREGS